MCGTPSKPIYKLYTQFVADKSTWIHMTNKWPNETIMRARSAAWQSSWTDHIVALCGTTIYWQGRAKIYREVFSVDDG